jgi:hypothetical protein
MSLREEIFLKHFLIGSYAFTQTNKIHEIVKDYHKQFDFIEFFLYNFSIPVSVAILDFWSIKKLKLCIESYKENSRQVCFDIVACIAKLIIHAQFVLNQV